eukprot:scaffold597734_cov106-Attheya_sp.AAC.2
MGQNLTLVKQTSENVVELYKEDLAETVEECATKEAGLQAEIASLKQEAHERTAQHEAVLERHMLEFHRLAQLVVTATPGIGPGESLVAGDAILEAQAELDHMEHARLSKVQELQDTVLSLQTKLRLTTEQYEQQIKEKDASFEELQTDFEHLDQLLSNRI